MTIDENFVLEEHLEDKCGDIIEALKVFAKGKGKESTGYKYFNKFIQREMDFTRSDLLLRKHQRLLTHLSIAMLGWKDSYYEEWKNKTLREYMRSWEIEYDSASKN